MGWLGQKAVVPRNGGEGWVRELQGATLQQQGQGLQDLPKHVGQFAMALATLSGAAPADDGDTQTPSPEQLPTPTSVPATTDARPAKKQKVALSSPEQAPAHLKVL